MNEEAIPIIQRYIDEHLFGPNTEWSEYSFRMRCHQRWAVNEILIRVMNEAMLLPEHISGRLEESPIDIVRGFIQDVDYFYSISTDKEKRLMFGIAREEGEHVLTLLEADKNHIFSS